MNRRTDSINAAEFDTGSDDVFGRISHRYDLLCDLFSFGIHRLWKREVARIISAEKWSVLLDTATGTGDIVLRVLNHHEIDVTRRILAADISPQMLSIASRRLGAHVESAVDLEVHDCEDLSRIESNSIDCYSMSLALKICNREAALTEAVRVVKPGGRIIFLEASNIPIKWVQRAYLAYMGFCMPLIGWLATGGDGSAYKYLLKGIHEFPTAEELKAELEELGLLEVEFRRLSFGIVAIHTARKRHD